MRHRIAAALATALVGAGLVLAQTRPTREEKVRNDKQKIEAEGFWIYNDLPRAFAEARQSGKPLLVVLRCVPCEECVKLDDQLIDLNPRVRGLLGQFVRARIVSTNGLDLSLFQYDTDQSFAVFLLNADGAIYGRFGTRSHRTEWTDDVSIDGMAKALEGALALHRAYPGNRAALAAKRGPAPEFASPEAAPALRDRYAGVLDFASPVVPRCIHCHQISEARQAWYLAKDRTLPPKVLFPYPHPKSIGLILDPQERATVLRVEAGTPAAAAGFRPGDAIRALEGQPLLSIADVQWVLHHANPDGARVRADILRGGRASTLTLTLPAGWRQRDNRSWRVSTWDLRRRALGGMLLADLPAEERKKLAVPEGAMALRVEHVGEYAPHDIAKKAGVRKGDILISFDGRTDLLRETDVLTYALTGRKLGEPVALTFLREGARIELTLTVPQT